MYFISAISKLLDSMFIQALNWCLNCVLYVYYREENFYIVFAVVSLNTE